MKHLWTIIALVLILSSCKAVEKYKRSSQFPTDCAAAFPVVPSVTFLPGQVVEIPGPTVDCDSIMSAYKVWFRAREAAAKSATPMDTIYLDKVRPSKEVKCPPSTHSVDTLAITKESTARLEACQRAAREKQDSMSAVLNKQKAKIEQLQNKLDKRTTQRNRLIYALSGLGLVIGLAVFGFVRSRG